MDSCRASERRAALSAAQVAERTKKRCGLQICLARTFFTGCSVNAVIVTMQQPGLPKNGEADAILLRGHPLRAGGENRFQVLTEAEVIPEIFPCTDEIISLRRIGAGGTHAV